MPLFLSLFQTLAIVYFSKFDSIFRRWLSPVQTSIWSGALQDLTRSKSELVLENALLRHQLGILQRQSKTPQFTSADRFWFLLLASRLKHWKDALLLLNPETLLRWHRAGFHLFWKHKAKPKTNPPKIAAETIALIQQMAQENPLWGAERIRGELLKLGIQVAKRTIQRYMRRAKPSRESNQKWATFLRNHAQDIWACDFLPVIDLSFRALRFFHHRTLNSPRGAFRRHATPDAGMGRTATPRSHAQWCASQMHRAPRANAVCERFLGSIRRECSDHLLIFSERQLYRVVCEYVTYFNRARPHQGLKQQIPEQLENARVATPATNKIIRFLGLKENDLERRRETPTTEEVKPNVSRGKIIAFPILNGLHHDYRRVA